jgi:hypothetical protein
MGLKTAPRKSRRNAAWIDAFILIGAGLFLFALLVAAVFDPTIRVLHALEALIYIAVIVLTRSKSAWGFGAGCIIAASWNYLNLFVTTFMKSGLHELSALIQSGQQRRPDLLIALVAGGGHFLLIIACLAGFLRTRPNIREWSKFVAGGCLAVGFLAASIVTTGPQYIGLLKRVFRL